MNKLRKKNMAENLTKNVIKQLIFQQTENKSNFDIFEAKKKAQLKSQYF